jgi:hypothetical protein
MEFRSNWPTGCESLNWLEERATRHGMDAPTSLLNEMDCEREAIARFEAELEQMRGKTGSKLKSFP